MKTKQKLEEIKKTGYYLNKDEILNQAFKNYKQIVVYASLVFLVLAFFSFFAIIYYLKIEGIDMKDFKQITQKLFTQKSDFKFVIVTILFSCFSAPFNASFFKMANCAKNDIEFNISSLFSYYKSPYFFYISIVTFIIAVFSLTITIIADLLNVHFISSFINLSFSFFSFLTIPFIIFGKLNPIKALKASFLVVSKNPMLLLFLFVISYIGALLGIFLFFIGVLFTSPFLFSMIYTIYDEIIGVEDIDDVEDDENSTNL